MIVKKQYLKSKPICKVTFQLAPDNTDFAKEVSLVGEFNDWDTQSTKMRKRKDGSFATTVSLLPDRRYEFRYLIDKKHWINDDGADTYTPSPYGSDNSVVTT